MSRRRSAMSLIASGAATITLDQHAVRIRAMPTREALMKDRATLDRDVRRALKAGLGEHEFA